ncbi:MAG: HyaD/HybD family hydrogenase maturation endopeptidase [Chloroflexi bacterium]|nr:HyaD/HybD family hydrogenase maturation endopeptidase [Chloroflexota bacterium]MBU1750192.1 HyaD/HybD family hydrogenase maturation endopeptidase [Chloroflexota bacterium]MBU1879372.1 HyaD/HybD family hydrogenase maturation endopeptidase [Chloroflexota bacterium]
MGDIAILGLGNTLLSDEGVGVHALERLRAGYAFPAHVRLLDGGTKDIELIGWLEDVDRLLVLDAVAANKPPGTLVRLADDDIPSHPGLALSPHQMGLRDLLATMELLDCVPAEIVLWGVVPASLETSVGLSPVVGAQMDALVDRALVELRRWGVEPRPLKTPGRRGTEWQPSVMAGEPK